MRQGEPSRARLCEQAEKMTQLSSGSPLVNITMGNSNIQANLSVTVCGGINHSNIKSPRQGPASVYNAEKGAD